LARLHTADILSKWGMPADIVETVQLLVSELATNAVRHPKEGEGQAPPFSSRNTVQTFEISLEIIGDAVRVSVWDRDTRPPVLKEVGVEATGGRGIFIVAVMSRRWGHYPARGMPGKVVWAECGLIPASRAGEDEKPTRSPARPPTAGPVVPRAAQADPILLGRDSWDRHAVRLVRAHLEREFNDIMHRLGVGDTELVHETYETASRAPSHLVRQPAGIAEVLHAFAAADRRAGSRDIKAAGPYRAASPPTRLPLRHRSRAEQRESREAGAGPDPAGPDRPGGRPRAGVPGVPAGRR
jgi:anti-sigma regulatory factor (Ser/Thr protein kinase)